MSEIFDIPSKDMNGLDAKLVKFNDLTDLKEKVIESVEAVYKVLIKELKAPNDITYTDHTDNQIASFIVTYFKTKYKIENDKKIVLNKGQASKINLTNLKDYLMQHYILDNIKDKWVGSGDKNLHDMVKNAVIKNSKYYQSVDENEMKIELERWFADKNDDTKKTIKPDTKMVLAYLLNKTAHSLSGKTGMLEFEHIGIKSKLEDEHILEGISSPSNLTLIPALDNKKKQRLTYYEYIKLMRNSLFKFSKSDFEKLLYPKHDEIKWAEGTKTIKKAEFEEFKETRTKMLIEKLMSFLYKE